MRWQMIGILDDKLNREDQCRLEENIDNNMSLQTTGFGFVWLRKGSIN